MIHETLKQITTTDGYTLSLHIFSPTDVEYHRSNCDGVILAVHGLGEHMNRYNQLAEITCHKNKIFAAFNVRGHGKNSAQKGDVQNLSCLILDIIQAFNTLKELFLNIKKNSFVLFGHSFGGLQATYAASVLLQEVKKIFLSAPFYANKQKIPQWKILLSNNLAHFAPGLNIPLGTNTNDLSNNPENNENYKNDPINLTNISARFGKTLLNAIDKNNVKAAIQNITAEVTIIIPNDDKLVDSQVTKELLSSFQTPVHTFEIEGAGHEAFNEVDNIRKIAFAHYEKWLENIA